MKPPHRSLADCLVFLAIALAVVAVPVPPAAGEENDAEVQRRLANDARYLASEKLEGRGLGSAGLELAGDYIAKQWATAGLKTNQFAGTPYQRLPVISSAALGAENQLTLFGPPEGSTSTPQQVRWRLREDYIPLASSSSAAVDLPLVFAGYGITAAEQNYDDYAGLDVKGKAVLLLRHEPASGPLHRPEDVGASWRNGSFEQKLLNARAHGAAAVLFVTDAGELRQYVRAAVEHWQQALDELAAAQEEFKRQENPTLEQIESARAKIDQLIQQAQATSDELRRLHDPLLPLEATSGQGTVSEIPTAQVRRTAADRLLQAATGESLAALEKQIETASAPRSRSLEPWQLVGKFDVVQAESEARNVVATLEASRPLAAEAIVVGAHYDHLGWGGRGSLAPKRHEIHPGADDNASGVSVLLEVARQLAPQRERLRRRVVFIAFTGEEMGVLGSSYYVQHPLVPLERTVAMINLDMVGRLRENRVLVGGVASGDCFASLLERLNATDRLDLVPKPSGYGPSDQIVFSPHHIPVLHFYTGTHESYHRPEDRFETLNLPGMGRIARLVAELVLALGSEEARPIYVPELSAAGE